MINLETDWKGSWERLQVTKNTEETERIGRSEGKKKRQRTAGRQNTDNQNVPGNGNKEIQEREFIQTLEDEE